MAHPSDSDPDSPTRRWSVSLPATTSESQLTTLASPYGSSGTHVDQPRFLPGALLGNRYRIVSLLGRGGMGEVYRADDLKLGQRVALKFLPIGARMDEATIAQLISEVRVGREVSHPNVCRLHDFVEVDGHQFVTMQLVDGEDLASVLRSRGALPESLVMRIAHDVCAGLAAAHAKGVLHRDLKPGNVLIDSNGQALISDFGLATLLKDKPDAARSGTPAYMAPEQFRGEPASPQTDLYSLGVMLYELLTGQIPFGGSSLQEMLEERAKPPVRPTQFVQDIDPRVDRLILQCLDADPARRPQSAAWLSEQLPGEDPLHAAIAMGLTPTRAMVAAARGNGLSLRATVGILTATLAAMALLFLMSERTSLHRRLLIKSPAVLEAEAIRLARAAGVEPAARYEARWYFASLPELRHAMSAGGLRNVAGTVPSPIRFVYRSSDAPLVPRFSIDSDTPPFVTESEPPLTGPGSLIVVLDSSGRLTNFDAVVDGAATPRSETWLPFLRASGVRLETLTDVAPRFVPSVGHDSRRSWRGRTLSGEDVNIEGASLRGRPVSYHVTPAWSRLSARREEGSTSPILVALLLVFLGGSTFLARRNLRVGRGDLPGALRLATTVMLTWIAWWVLGGAAATGALYRWNAVSQMLWQGLYWAFIMWLGYIALEPFVRRRWPQTLVGWTRLFDGRLLDPLVGRDVLIGVAAGLALSLARQLRVLVPMFLGFEEVPFAAASSQLGGSGVMLQEIAATFFSAFGDSLGSLLIFLVLRVVTRRTWIAAAIWIVAITALNSTAPANVWIGTLMVGLFVIIMLVVMIRWGLLALTTALFTTIVLRGTPLTVDLTVPYAAAAMTSLAAILVLLLCGFVAARNQS